MSETNNPQGDWLEVIKDNLETGNYECTNYSDEFDWASWLINEIEHLRSREESVKQTTHNLNKII